MFFVFLQTIYLDKPMKQDQKIGSAVVVFLHSSFTVVLSQILRSLLHFHFLSKQSDPDFSDFGVGR